jgi:hypothetical protein
VLRDRHGHWRRIEARLVMHQPPGSGWHYVAKVIPSRRGQRYRGDDGEPVEGLFRRIEYSLTCWLSGW